MFAYTPPEQLANLETAKAELGAAARRDRSRPAKVRRRLSVAGGDCCDCERFHRLSLRSDSREIHALFTWR